MDSEIKKVFFIVNKYSGSGFKAEMENSFRKTCKDHNWEFALEYTQGPGHATSLAAGALSAGFDKIAAVGGDGTVNEVAQALVHNNAAMAIIPKGSGNGLARHLGIPINVTRALDLLFTSKVIPIDTFLLNNKLSLNVSGIGFDGYISNLFQLERRRGFQGYTKLVLNEFMSFPEFEAEITTDHGVTKTKAFVIAVANSSQYGNNARIAPAASVCDGLLDLAILKKFPPYRLDYIYSLFSGTINQSACCETVQVRKASVQLPAPMAFHIDGEPAGMASAFTINLQAASLNVLVPPVGHY